MFVFNDTATTEIYTLALHDALPISHGRRATGGRHRCSPPGRRPLLRSERPGPSSASRRRAARPPAERRPSALPEPWRRRSEEHTSELQSRQYLVCRLLLEKKKY